MMAACLADGVTVLKNSAREPEVVALADYLNRMGACVEGAGTDEITVRGVDELTPSSCEVIPDRIEAGTYLVAAGITGGRLKLKGCRPDHLQAVVQKLRDSGLSIESNGDLIEVHRKGRIRSVNIETQPFPGFPTDMQAQFMALMALAGGVSLIKERIFENRFMHVLELQRMGADIDLDGRTDLSSGPRLRSHRE